MLWLTFFVHYISVINNFLTQEALTRFGQFKSIIYIITSMVGWLWRIIYIYSIQNVQFQNIFTNESTLLLTVHRSQKYFTKFVTILVYIYEVFKYVISSLSSFEEMAKYKIDIAQDQIRMGPNTLYDVYSNGLVKINSYTYKNH